MIIKNNYNGDDHSGHSMSWMLTICTAFCQTLEVPYFIKSSQRPCGAGTITVPVLEIMKLKLRVSGVSFV